MAQASSFQLKFLRSIAHHVVTDLVILEDKDEAAQVAAAIKGVEALMGNLGDPNAVLGEFVNFPVAKKLEADVISHIVQWARLKARCELEKTADVSDEGKRDTRTQPATPSEPSTQEPPTTESTTDSVTGSDETPVETPVAPIS